MVVLEALEEADDDAWILLVAEELFVDELLVDDVDPVEEAPLRLTIRSLAGITRELEVITGDEVMLEWLRFDKIWLELAPL